MILGQGTADAATRSHGELIAVLIFAGAMVGGLVIIRLLTTKRLTVTFARLYGLIATAGLGVTLAALNADTDSKTAAFTLLGTVAGYLAGAKPTVGGAADADTALRPNAGGSGGTDDESRRLVL